MCIFVICCHRHQPQNRNQVMNYFIIRDQVLVQGHVLDQVLTVCAADSVTMYYYY